MLKVQKNSRQIPSVERYTADKKYHDLLYGVMQEMSYAEIIGNDVYRYVNKEDITMKGLGDRIGLTRQTTKKKFDHLLELGLIEYMDDENRYELHYLDKSISTLVPFETLRRLNNSLSQNSISLFVYLLKRFIANNETEFIATMSQMKKFIGITSRTTSNNEVITDILDVLQAVGLIEFEYRQAEDMKTYLFILQVNNTMTYV